MVRRAQTVGHPPRCWVPGWCSRLSWDPAGSVCPVRSWLCGRCVVVVQIKALWQGHQVSPEAVVEVVSLPRTVGTLSSLPDRPPFRRPRRLWYTGTQRTLASTCLGIMQTILPGNLHKADGAVQVVPAPAGVPRVPRSEAQRCGPNHGPALVSLFVANKVFVAGLHLCANVGKLVVAVATMKDAQSQGKHHRYRLCGSRSYYIIVTDVSNNVSVCAVSR